MLGNLEFGRYELVERLAVGSTTELFVVRAVGEHGFRRQIVLARLRDDACEAAFIEDAKLSAKLAHSKIVQTLELGRIADVPYVAMEYVDGVDLLGLLAELARVRRPLDAALAVWIAHEIADALDYAHTFVDDGTPRPIVHARLSPSKVLLGENGEVKLRDFGVSRRFELGRSDHGHLSPEQVAEQPIDARSDVFGVGVLLAEMLMCKRLFAARNEFDVLLMVRDVRVHRLDLGGVDPELVTIVKKALEKKPDDRWPTAAALRDALDAWLFARRALNMNQRLAALVGEVREEVDRWRRGDPLTPSFDAVPDLTPAPIPTPLARGSIAPRSIRRVSIPPRVQPEDERVPARGTVGPPPAPPQQAPAVPRAREPRPVAPPWQPEATAKPAGPIGLALEDVLPARTPAQTRRPAQLLSDEQLAKAGQPPLPALVHLERPPDDGGDFERTSPLRVLFHLMRARATGLLAVTLDDVRKDVYVRDGQLAGVWSNDANDLFGNYLVAHRVLSEGELAMALATMSYYGGRIGDTLVGLNLLSRIDVFRHLTRHARTKVVDICTWTRGRYAWYAGKEDPRESFPLEPDAFSMLGEAVLGLADDVMAPWLAKHRDARVFAVKTQRVPPTVFGIPGAAALLAIDGTRTLGAIVAAAPNHAEAVRVLYLFLACDFVRLG